MNIQLTRSIPVNGEYDVVVCGGGPAGYAAALAARRSGLSVLLIEGQGQLGGMATSGLVSHWLGGRMRDGRWVVGGIFKELSLAAEKAGAALIPEDDPEESFTPHGWHKSMVHGIPLDPFGVALLLDRKAASEHVDVLLHTRAVDAVHDGERLTHIITHNKSGLQAVAVRSVIDATGDADIAALAECGYDKGNENGDMAPVTLELHVYNVDQDTMADYVKTNNAPRFREFIKMKRQEGAWTQNGDIFVSVQLTEKGVLMLNTTRICGIDGTDGRSVSEGTQQERAEIDWLLSFLREHMPGFKNVRVKAVAPLLGVRETRRIHGLHRMTVEEVINGARYPDVVGFTSYPWDLADPKRPTFQPMHARPKPPVVPIPYRIMVPKQIKNLICPGRAVSVERDVLGPLRVMAPCMAMGEAAGAAAEQVVRNGRTFSSVDAAPLRNTLRERGAIVDWDETPAGNRQ